ncbi:alpha/beta-hydrolase [Mycena rosella]|uniref:Carboxypeptidase n=1 Tax=Mycena rosella TaxID=1033263 RepID=A0AAD7GB84_MYCRO|nr:alpha/beta-hydrolase [Mycena rosella]
MHPLTVLVTLGLSSTVLGQGANSVPNSFPHAWPGEPQGPFSPKWQSYFEVTERLPNITGTLPRNFAGNIPVNRAGHPNDTLFFWAFEHAGKNGSLTSPADANNTDPWIIWLQGGPGSSGMIALTTENGPIHIQPNNSWFINEFSWNTLADSIWVDQPVGTGFSTSDSTGYVADEDQTGEDFVGFLSNLVKVFPSLATRPLFLAGESYAGTYIPYITKHIFQTPNPPVKLRKITIGDGSLGSEATVEHLPILNVIETYPALIAYDQQVFEFFREQTHLCGFDLNLTYPQNGHFPTLNLTRPTSNSALSESLLNPTEDRARTLRESVSVRFAEVQDRDAFVREIGHRSTEHQQWKRDLSGRANGTIDPFYGCFLLDELVDYAVNFTFPWTNGEFDVYDIPDATNPEPFKNASTFFNDNRTRAALHSPTSKDWIRNFNYPFGSVHNRSVGNQYGDPSVEPIAFLSDLATNATANNVSIVFYSGNDDSLVQHRGTEVIIQNMTFGGTQGFTRKPSTPWFDDDGNFAGIVHQERGVTYLLFDGAGHLVPMWKPAQALVFLREFVLGSNLNGTVSGSTGTVVGGENTTLANGVLPGGDEIFFGSSTTAGTSTIPAATRAAWASFIATATASSPLGSNINNNTNSAKQGDVSLVAGVIACLLAGAMLS